MNKKKVRQGDVLLIPARVSKKGLLKGSCVLALGEVTGHKHQFRSEVVYKPSSGGLAQELVLEQDSLLTHEEHDSIVVPKGSYRVVIQRRMDVLGVIRQVND